MPYKDPEKRRAQRKRWRDRNREKCRKYSRKSYWKLRYDSKHEHRLEVKRKHYANNRERYKEKKKRLRGTEKARATARAYRKRYYAENRAAYLEKQKKNKADFKKRNLALVRKRERLQRRKWRKKNPRACALENLKKVKIKGVEYRVTGEEGRVLAEMKLALHKAIKEAENVQAEDGL